MWSLIYIYFLSNCCRFYFLVIRPWDGIACRWVMGSAFRGNTRKGIKAARLSSVVNWVVEQLQQRSGKISRETLKLGRHSRMSVTEGPALALQHQPVVGCRMLPGKPWGRQLLAAQFSSSGVSALSWAPSADKTLTTEVMGDSRLTGNLDTPYHGQGRECLLLVVVIHLPLTLGMHISQRLEDEEKNWNYRCAGVRNIHSLNKYLKWTYSLLILRKFLRKQWRWIVLTSGTEAGHLPVFLPSSQ